MLVSGLLHRATMHEISIVEALIDQVEREVARSGEQGRVVRLYLSIGRLSGVCPDSLRFAWELLAPETSLAGAAMHITEPKAVCCCGKCGAKTEIEELLAQCPECGSPAIHFDGGREMILETIELEDS